MFKQLVSILLLSAFATLAWADEASIRNALGSAYPKFKVERVTKTPYEGLYEVIIGGQAIYTDEQPRFLIVEGKLAASRVNVSANEQNEAGIKKAFQAAFPKANVESVTKTPYDGLYELFATKEISYIDKKVSFVISGGKLVDVKTKKDLTSERLAELNKIDFSNLPFDQAIKVVKGNGSRKLAVFSDADCPYCQRLEKQELANITDVTIYTFLYPIAQIHPDAANKSKYIWCDSDRAKAWQNWMLYSILPAKFGSCDTPIAKNIELANKLGVTSTPTLFFADGKRILGAQPYKDIERAMGAAPASSQASTTAAELPDDPQVFGRSASPNSTKAKGKKKK